MSCILAIDDRPINRQFLVSLLGYGGHTVLEAADGEEALKIVHQSHPDLVNTGFRTKCNTGDRASRNDRSSPSE